MKQSRLLLIVFLLNGILCAGGGIHAADTTVKPLTNDPMELYAFAEARMSKLEHMTYVFRLAWQQTEDALVINSVVDTVIEHDVRYAIRLEKGMMAEFSFMQSSLFSEFFHHGHEPNREWLSMQTSYEYAGNDSRYSIRWDGTDFVEEHQWPHVPFPFSIEGLLPGDGLHLEYAALPFKHIIAQSGKVVGNSIVCGEVVYALKDTRPVTFKNLIIRLTDKGLIDSISCTATRADPRAEEKMTFELQFTSHTEAQFIKPEEWKSHAQAFPGYTIEGGARGYTPTPLHAPRDLRPPVEKKPAIFYARVGVITRCEPDSLSGYFLNQGLRPQKIPYSGPAVSCPSTLMGFISDESDTYAKAIPLLPGDDNGYFVDSEARPVSVAVTSDANGSRWITLETGGKTFEAGHYPPVLIHKDSHWETLDVYEDFATIQDMGNFYCVVCQPGTQWVGMLIQQGPLMP